jgi:hypothetical protein
MQALGPGNRSSRRFAKVRLARHTLIQEGASGHRNVRKAQLKAGAQADHEIRDLFALIQATTLGGPLPDALTRRLERAQQQFLRGDRPAFSELTLADAINRLGCRLNAAVYTGTNELQLHLLRKGLCRNVPVLLACPETGEPDADALSPAGAAYIGFLLLRQKLANPAWFGNPDEQNKAWIAFEANPKKGEQKVQYRLSVQAEPVEATEFRALLRTASSHRRSKPAKAFAKFLDELRF